MDTSVKVHIVLSEAVRRSDETLAQASKRLIEDFHVKGLNGSRLRRFGIASGEMPVRLVKPLADTDFVESVTRDEQREVGNPLSAKSVASPSAPAVGAVARALSMARSLLVGR